MTSPISGLDLRVWMRPAGSVTTMAVWLALVALIVFGLLRYENFGSAHNIASFLGYNSMFILISVGMCFVIMTGGIDLSVGSVAAFASVVAALLSAQGLVVALAGGLAAGVAFGGINAFVVVAMRVPPFMATLATMLGGKGAALVLSGNRTVPVSWTSDFTSLGMDRALGVLPWTIVIAAVLVFVLWFWLEKTSLGRTVLAVGGSRQASVLMGLKVDRAVAVTYLISGGCAGLAGVFLAAGYGAGQPLEGVGWELAAIASVVVGGTLLTGGLGSVPATVAGALLFGLVFNILNFENGRGTISLSAYWQAVIRGGFLLAVILLQVRLQKLALGRSSKPDPASKG